MRMPRNIPNGAMTNGSFGIILLLLLALAVSGPELWAAQVDAEDTDQHRQLIGKQLTEALEQRRSLNVTGLTFRRVAKDLSRNTGIAICLDRRTNPSALTRVATEYVTTKNIFEALARAQTQTAASFTDQFVYIGPTDAARRLRTLTELRHLDVQGLRSKMDSANYRRLVESRKVSWPDLAQPRQLLTRMASEVHVELENPEAVPHDLWAQADLPPLPFSNFATLILNQYDLTFALTADGIMKLIPVPETVIIERRHRVPSKEKAEVRDRWNANFPKLDIEWKGSTAVVVTTIEIHEQLESLSRGESSTGVAAVGIKERLFTMKAPRGTAIGNLIASLRQQGIPIRVTGKPDAELVPLLQQTVEFDVTKSPGFEFFPKIFAGWGADVTVTDDEVLLTFPSTPD